ncbi:hypothetical protein MMC22_008393 [Lobaria immixta]|nr:hypothetical protein [Lobaria immixta]
MTVHKYVSDRPSVTTAPSAIEGALAPAPVLGHDMSRSSSTSTLLQYQPAPANPDHTRPGLSALASIASDHNSHARAYNNINGGHIMMTYATSSPAATTGGGQGNNNIPPVCQNCTTSTTPLWRRDEIGSVLCNACGLFLKLHGTPRPISLKTDVIKSRNRVKTASQAQKKKSLFEGNGIAAPRSEAGTPPPSLLHNQRASRKTSSGGSERSFSPVSRTDTPTSHHPSNIAPQHLFDGVSLSEHAFQPSPSMPSLNLRAPSPGSTSSANDRHLEPPQTYDGLLQFNTTLKTRVSELEVINDLFRGRVNELEQSDANARRAEAMQQESESQLRQLLEQTQARENELKRQVEELEREVADLRGPEPRAKRQRVSDDSEYPDPPLPFTA